MIPHRSSGAALLLLSFAWACAPKASSDAPAAPAPAPAPPGPEYAPLAAEPPPSAAPAAAPSATPSAAASIDPHNCAPRGPSVRWEVKDDDVLHSFDAQGCQTSESSFKSNGFGYKASVDFMTDLQGKVKAHDKNGLADLASYPLRVNGKGKGAGALQIKDRAAFLKAVDRVYTPGVSAAILAVDPRDLFCNYQGVMLGNGVIWAGNERGHYGVIAINVP